MQWLNELPFADNRVLQIGFLAACGIAALIVLAIFYRLAFAHRLRVPGGRTRQPRLGLVDAFSLDGQRQLVLVRRDNIEHLVMIGGPNDVLVESQINRAVVPARESTQASPLLVPATPVRRTEAVAIPGSPAAEPLAKAPAKAPVSAPAVPVAGPTVTPPIPKAPAPPQPIPPASAQPPAPVPVPASAPEPAGHASAGPAATTQASDSALAAPASPLSRQAEPRPAQPRATMPPPIIPANGSPNRGTLVRATETAPARGPGNSLPAPPPAALAPARRPEKAEAEAANLKAEPTAATAKMEPRAAPAGTIVPSASVASAQGRPAAKTAASDWARKVAEARPPGDKPNPAPNPEPAAKPANVDDPFGDLDSLEAEMARLLGREKSD